MTFRWLSPPNHGSRSTDSAFYPWLLRLSEICRPSDDYDRPMLLSELNFSQSMHFFICHMRQRTPDVKYGMRRPDRHQAVIISWVRKFHVVTQFQLSCRRPLRLTPYSGNPSTFSMVFFHYVYMSVIVIRDRRDIEPLWLRHRRAALSKCSCITCMATSRMACAKSPLQNCSILKSPTYCSKNGFRFGERYKRAKLYVQVYALSVHFSAVKIPRRISCFFRCTPQTSSNQRVTTEDLWIGSFRTALGVGSIASCVRWNLLYLVCTWSLVTFCGISKNDRLCRLTRGRPKTCQIYLKNLIIKNKIKNIRAPKMISHLLTQFCGWQPFIRIAHHLTKLQHIKELAW